MNHSPATLASMSRIRKRKRAALRAALDGQTLIPDQIKVAVAEVDALSATISKLTEQSLHWNDSTSPREVDALMTRADELTAKSRALSAHPQVNAAILAREAKERRS